MRVQSRVAVISGIGVRGFYRRLGYEAKGRGGFMIKDIRQNCADRVRLVPLVNFILILVAVLAIFAKDNWS